MSETKTQEVDVQKELNAITGKYTVIYASPTWIAESGLMDKNKHDGAIKMTSTHDGIQRCPVNEQGMLLTGLTYAQQVAFEKALNMKPGALSPYPERDDRGREKISFWTAVSNMIRIPKEGLKLNCDESIEDKLIYMNLMASYRKDQNGRSVGMLAISKLDAEDNPNARWIMYSDEVETKAIGDQGLLLSRAFKAYANMGSSDKRDFFKIYRNKNTGYKTGDLTKDDLVDQKILEVVQKDPKTYLEILEDKNFKDFVFIEDLLANNIIKQVGTTLKTHEDETIGTSKTDAIINLHNKDFQNLKVALKSRLETVLKK